MWMLEAWVAVTVAGGAQVAAWRPRPWLPGYLFGSHFFIVDGCDYLFREGFWEIFEIFFWGGEICQLEIGVAWRGGDVGICIGCWLELTYEKMGAWRHAVPPHKQYHLML
jgi:hypothetical protein